MQDKIYIKGARENNLKNVRQNRVGKGMDARQHRIQQRQDRIRIPAR